MASSSSWLSPGRGSDLTVEYSPSAERDTTSARLRLPMPSAARISLQILYVRKYATIGANGTKKRKNQSTSMRGSWKKLAITSVDEAKNTANSRVSMDGPAAGSEE